MFSLQNAETKVEEAAKESPKAARLTQQSSEDNEVFGELFRQLVNVTWSVLFLCVFYWCCFVKSCRWLVFFPSLLKTEEMTPSTSFWSTWVWAVQFQRDVERWRKGWRNKQRVIKGVKYIMSEEKFVVGYYRGERVNASLQKS